MATVETCYFEVDSLPGDSPHDVVADLDVNVTLVRIGGFDGLDTWRVAGDYAQCVEACNVLDVDISEIEQLPN
jgi:hypothetical protein